MSDAVADETVEAPVADPLPESGEDVTDAPSEVVDEDALIYEKVDEDDSLAPKPVSPYDRPGRWFVVHTQSVQSTLVKCRTLRDYLLPDIRIKFEHKVI